MMEKFKKMADKLVLGALLLLGVAGNAAAVNTFGVDLAAITTDLTTVGTLMVGLAVFFLGYKWVRRILAR